MKFGAALRNKNELGVAAIHWPSHVKAIQSKVIISYLDGSRSSWKLVLDEWYSRTPEGRGAVFSTTPTYGLTCSLTRRKSALPALFKHALNSFREIPFEKATPGAFLSQDEARAEPAWCSNLFQLKNLNYYQTWRVAAEFNRVQDFLTPDNELWSNEQITNYFSEKFVHTT